jgi:hypothetical protein
MLFVKAARVLTGAVIILTTLTPPMSAQTSIGFENPGDTSNILEYRLPDWGYRTWDLRFQLNGGGSEGYAGDDYRTARNNFLTGLGSRFNLYRESESRTYRVFADGDGNYRKYHDSAGDSERSGHDLNGRIQLGGNWKQFLGDGPFSLRAGGNTSQRYAETIEDNRFENITQEFREFSRQHAYALNLDAGLGRVRDVTPLIRAQRLSERLTGLGREPLAPDQVREIARVLATEQGYRIVFDRPDKSFWRNVLEPMLDPENPLATYEVFYLRDILEEDIGPRGEGMELRAGYFYGDTEVSSSSDERRTIYRGPELGFHWVKNLSFDHQLSLGARTDYLSTDRQVGSGDVASATFDLAYLWTIADRYRWDTDLIVHATYLDLSDESSSGISRDLETRLHSEFTVFLENSLSLNLSVNGTNIQAERNSSLQDLGERYFRTWQWSYGIGLQYYLDRVLY